MVPLYRVATPDEVTFYTGTLYPLQDRVFRCASIYQDRIYLTGGTALSRFYFHYRYSEDLDFFTCTDDLRIIALDLAARLENQQLEVEIERAEVYFARFYVHQPGCVLKVEFVREFHRIGSLQLTGAGVHINTLEDVGANKVTAFGDRAEVKDIVDLYFIQQRLPLERLFELADSKRVPVAYEHLLTINVEGISGMALLSQELDSETLERFVGELKRRAEAEIKKKERITPGRTQQIIERLLWDFPREARCIHAASLPVLKRRMRHLPLPQRRALEHRLSKRRVS